MSSGAIQADSLSKRYRIEARRRVHDTLTGAIAGLIGAPLSNLRRLKRLTSFREGDDGEDVLWALRDVSFDVAEGEVLGIVGRNGAGKTTLLKVLAGITVPTGGRAVIRGRVASLLEVGVGFHPDLSGRENAYLSGTILGMTRREIDRRFDEIVAFSEIEKFLDTPLKRYSSGMRVRLAFAVAAHLDPEILLIDEVLAVGDADFQRKCLGKMNSVASAGRTVLFVSHNTSAVQGLCERVIWMEKGRIRMDDASAVVVPSYLESFSSGVSERKWLRKDEAPGNDSVRIRHIAVRPADGSPSDQITMDVPCDLEIEYWNEVSGQELDITIQLVTQDGCVAFGSSTLHADGRPGRGAPSGLYRSTCRIPANLLNAGLYVVRLLAVQNQTTVLHKEEAIITIDVADDVSTRGKYFGRRLGAVRPLLSWTVTAIDG